MSEYRPSHIGCGCSTLADMARYRPEGLETGGVYHLLNRTVERRPAFQDVPDHKRFLSLLAYCQWPRSLGYAHAKRLFRAPRAKDSSPEGNAPLIDVLSYCLMPTHFHLLVQQRNERGVSHFMQRVLNSYTRYFNTRHVRPGPLFAGGFRSVRVSTDHQLLHVMRYIHLNPYAAGLTDDPFSYPWSSVRAYTAHFPTEQRSRDPFSRPQPRVDVLPPLNTDLIRAMLPAPQYTRFILDHAAHARELERIKHLLFLESQEAA